MSHHLIPNGTYKIKNVEYHHYVADLINGIPRGPISAYTENPGNRNDKWKIENHGHGGNQITIESVSVPQSYANAEQFQGSSLHGSHSHTIWTVVKVDHGYYLQSPDAEYVWELPNGANYVHIVLVKHSGKANTKWTFEKVHE